MFRLVRSGDVNADVFCLLLGQFGETATEGFHVDAGDFLVEDLGQAVHLIVVLIAVGEQLDLRDGLVRKGVGHDKGWVAGGVAQVEQAAF